MSSATENARNIDEARARAEQWLVGMRRLHDRVMKYSRETINELNTCLQEVTVAEDYDRIIDFAETYERRLGAVEVHVSPYKAGTPLAQRRQKKAKQVELFESDESGT